MCNSIFIGKKTIPKAKDGEEFELTIKGVYHTDEEGDRHLEVMEVDGDAVIDPMESESACADAREGLMHQDGEDALKIFLIKTRKEK